MQHLAPDAAELLDEPDTSAVTEPPGTPGGTLPPPLRNVTRSSREPELGSLVRVGPSVSPPAPRPLVQERHSVVVERSSWLGLCALLMVGQIVGTVSAAWIVAAFRPGEPSPAKLSVGGLLPAPEPQNVASKPAELTLAPGAPTAVGAPTVAVAPAALPPPATKKAKRQVEQRAPVAAPIGSPTELKPGPTAARDRLFDSMY